MTVGSQHLSPSSNFPRQIHQWTPQTSKRGLTQWGTLISSISRWIPHRISLSLSPLLLQSTLPPQTSHSPAYLSKNRSKYVYELHIRSITTNLPHPKSPLSVLPCLVKPSASPPPSEVIAAVRVQVAGDLVALLIKEVLDSAGAHLEIWNWEHSPQFSVSLIACLIG